MRAAAIPLGLLVCAPLLAAVGPVVIDTDAGSDDLMAIAFLLARPDVRIEAINVVHGLAHVPAGAGNIRKLLAAAGSESVPVRLGREKPLEKTAEFPAVWRKISDELLANLPAAKGAMEKQDAVSYYRSRDFTGATVLALGPLTNLAAAVQAGARFGEILMMGGAVRVPGNLGDGGYFKTSNKTAEWNVFCDPKAAEVVFRSGAGIRMVPLDATNETPLDLKFLEKFLRLARTPLAKAVAQLLEKDREFIAKGMYYAWDPLAAAAFVEPGVARWQDLPIRVRRDGTTEEAARGGNTIRVAVHAEGARFRELFLAALLNPE